MSYVYSVQPMMRGTPKAKSEGVFGASDLDKGQPLAFEPLFHGGGVYTQRVFGCGWVSPPPPCLSHPLPEGGVFESKGYLAWGGYPPPPPASPLLYLMMRLLVLYVILLFPFPLSTPQAPLGKGFRAVQLLRTTNKHITEPPRLSLDTIDLYRSETKN